MLKNGLKKDNCTCSGSNRPVLTMNSVSSFLQFGGRSVLQLNWRANKWEVFVCWSRDNVGVSKYVGGDLRSRQPN